MKRVYGIVGWPVWHTRSPIMHTAAIEALGLDAVYVPFGVPPSRLEDAVRGLGALGIRGVNVTLPHKTAILPLLDEVDADAEAIGAVNTIVMKGKRLYGTNTDAPGLVRALRDAGYEPRGKKVVVIGAGGAARAAVAGLGRAGASEIVVAARRQEQAERLVADLSRTAGKTKLVASDLATVGKPAHNAKLLVQATSATLDDGPESGRFAANLPYAALAADAIVTDVVYAPRMTAVLRAATRHHLQIVDGLGMLLHQGAIAFEAWTGKKPPLQTMREALG